ncbi:FHA domain-containing protein [Desulfococcaceae bacterium HSG8]|nr:FHA domain-containing protein [Desulfococcaceae bacterium HSG8]
MLAFCEECGAKNEIDPQKMEGGKPPRCNKCDTVLKFSIVHPPPSAPSADEPGVLHLLELRFHDHIIEISQARPTVTMGRQRHNDLVVQDNRVSRSHARFEYRKGQFLLIDQSTNGTYVFIKGQKGMNLKQDELPVQGSGIIGLGRKVTPDSPQAIHFTVI